MSNTKNEGMGLLSTLGLIFVVLKLVGVITWSWFWVISPFWIGISAYIFGIILIIIASFFINKK